TLVTPPVALHPLPFEPDHLVLGEKFTIGELDRTLHGRERLVRVSAHQIRVAPRCPGNGPPGSLPGHRQRRQDRQREHPRQRGETATIHQTLPESLNSARDSVTSTRLWRVLRRERPQACSAPSSCPRGRRTRTSARPS